MKFAAVILSALLVAGLTCTGLQAQVVFNGNYTLTPVNNGTGAVVSIPIPGGSGLSVTLGTGSAAIPLQDIRGNPSAVNITQGDDDFRNIPLGFEFPFYGRSFNNSWAMTNGLVTFQDPNQSGLGGACCEGVDLRTTTSSAYNYSIFGLHSDLFSPSADNQYYLRGTNEMTYGWYGVSQCCGPNGGNSFEIKINSLGLVDTRIAGAMISGNRVTSGMSGNLANGEYFQAYHGSGLSIVPGSADIFSWRALGGTGAVDMCTINPLSSPTCPGYTAAYTTQQCSISALYDPSCPGYTYAYTQQQCSINPLYSETCPGYQSAYTQQQCSINPLYSTACSGYDTAYKDQQCSLNQLYATDCPGYASAYLSQQCKINPLYSTTCLDYEVAYQHQQCSLNPLYATTCRGYAAAYKEQQCNANPLVATDCPGYATAYKTQQCSISALYATDCPGYATAYKTQQCGLNALYATDCPGYATAYKTQQCAANPLFATDCPRYDTAYKTQQCLISALYATDCPGWAQANLNAQCIKDSLYSTECEGYKTAYAIKYLVGLNPAVTTAVNSTLTNIVETQRNDPANVTGTVDAVPAVANTSTAAATTSATSISPVAVMSTVRPSPPPMATMAQAEPKKDGAAKEEKKDEGTKKNDSGPNNAGPSGDTKPSDQPKTNREAIQERRREAAQKDAVAKGANLANEMGKAADMESQKAIQNVVIQAMGFTPGFDTYNKAMIPDTTFYKPFTVYGNQKNVDNQQVSRRLMGGSDRTHQEMVDSQFQLGK